MDKKKSTLLCHAPHAVSVRIKRFAHGVCLLRLADGLLRSHAWPPEPNGCPLWCGVVWCGVVWCAEGAVTKRQKAGMSTHGYR